MSEPRVLIVDDEPDIRELLEITLGRMNLITRAAENVAQAKTLLEGEAFDLCLTDMNLPDGSGMEIVKLIGERHPQTPVAMITAHGSMDSAIDALKSGAFDFVQKPVDLDQLRTLVEFALKIDATSADPGSSQLIGSSAEVEHLRAQIAKLARSQAPIYISGESGSGKEVAARLMHEQGPRSGGPFVPVNCGAIPSELMESEFFGHTKGSFTGAVVDKAGLFEVAEGGTLFLDEVADLPLSMQVKLLRAIQEKSVRRVGGVEEKRIDVRILSATHKNLAAEVADGRFRQDLYYRLNVIELHMPSLRERSEDIPAFTQHILSRLARDYGTSEPQLSDGAIVALQSYAFPGNVRQLENVLERAFTLCEDQMIQPEDLGLEGVAPASDERSAETMAASAQAEDTPATDDPPAMAPTVAPAEGSLDEQLEAIERQLITQALEQNRWNKTAAAKDLGITFRALRYKLKKLEME